MFKPLHDYLLVLPIERKQSSVLWVSPEKYNRGVIIACGPGERLKRKNGKETGAMRQMEVHPGDFILYGDLDWIFPKYEENGLKFRICQEKDVCGVVDVNDFDGCDIDLSQIVSLISAYNQNLFRPNVGLALSLMENDYAA